MKMIVEKRGNACAEKVDLSPMIDMVFILLIFFVIAAVFVEDLGFAADTPDQAPPILAPQNQNLTIHVDKSNRVFWEQERISLESVQVKVAQRVTANAETTVLVHAQELTNAGFLVELLDRVRLGGVETVSLVLERE
jgi:biopolymer transport protein ExbD